MKNIFVEVEFIDADENILKNNINIEETYLKIIKQYAKYINGNIMK